MTLNDLFDGSPEALEYWQAMTLDAQLYALGRLGVRVLETHTLMRNDQAEVVHVLRDVVKLLDERDARLPITREAASNEAELVAAPAEEQLVTPEASAEQLVSTSAPADAANAAPPGKRDRRRKRDAAAAE